MKTRRFTFPEGAEGNRWLWCLQQIVYSRGDTKPNQQGALPAQSKAEQRTDARLVREIQRISVPNPDPRIPAPVDGTADLRIRLLKDGPQTIEILEDDWAHLWKYIDQMQWATSGVLPDALDFEDALRNDSVIVDGKETVALKAVQ